MSIRGYCVSNEYTGRRKVYRLCSNRQGSVLHCDGVLGPHPEWYKKPDTDGAHLCKTSVLLQDFEAGKGKNFTLILKGVLE